MNRHIKRLSVLCLYISISLLSYAHAVEHFGANNPTIEGWSVNSTDTGTSGIAVNDTEFPNISAWEINETGSARLRYEIDGPNTNDYWRLSARLRIVDLNDALDAGSLIEIANGTTRYALSFGSDASGNTLIKVVTGSFTGTPDIQVNTTTTTTEYINILIDYDPTAGTSGTGAADIYINNILESEDYQGFAGSGIDRVNFGDGAGTATGQTRYVYVKFEIDANQDGFYDLDNDGIDDREDIDLDGDDLSNDLENSSGTNPLDSDTDNDGFSDGIEVSFGTDPLSAVNNPITHKIIASDGTADDVFGFSVSVSGDTAVIGANQDDDNGGNSGSAYVFTRTGNTWTEQQKLTASDGAAFDVFGNSVALSGDTALIGAFGDDDNGSSSGSAYVFTRTGNTWTEQQKLTASDGAANDAFGYSVALSGDTALIGARLDNDNGSASGSVYVFTRTGNTWTEQQKLTASDGAAGDLFGFSVSVSGDTAVIGAYFDDDNGSDSGSAYVFTRSGTTWTEQQKLTASDGAGSDQFGFSVSVSGDTAVIGAYFDDDNGINSGSAYVFTRSGTTWTEQQKLTASDGAAFDVFGDSVALSGDNTALIGAFGDDDNGSASGSVYVFTRSGTTWTEQQKLTASDGAGSDQFGFSVSVSGDTALISASLDDDNGSSSGSGYLIDLDVDDDNLLNATEIALGTDILLSDSDGDGLNDFDEVNRDGDPNNYTIGVDTDPNNEDTDGDTFNDGDEILAGSDPLDINSTPNNPNPNPTTVNVPLPLWSLVLLAWFLILNVTYIRRFNYSAKADE